MIGQGGKESETRRSVLPPDTPFDSHVRDRTITFGGALHVPRALLHGRVVFHHLTPAIQLLSHWLGDKRNAPSPLGGAGGLGALHDVDQEPVLT